MTQVSRRSFLKGAGLAAAAIITPGCEHPTADPQPRARYAFFNADEAAFIEAAVARLIPADELGPGALEADVPGYIDRQLAGAWGAGERLYRSGPWDANAAATMGYQLPFTPAELFRNALRAVSEDVRNASSRPFDKLSADAQDAYLKQLESGSKDLGGVPAKIFFQSLLEMTVEGFFADPVYGGNRNMIGWKLIGFPGAYANYYELVDKHGIAFKRSPMSLAEDASGAIHVHPVRVVGAPDFRGER